MRPASPPSIYVGMHGLAMPEPRTHDITRPSWGHNFSVIDWTKGEMFVWLTPGPRKGDILLIPGRNGVIRARVKKTEWMANVDDMYKVKVVPARENAGNE